MTANSDAQHTHGDQTTKPERELLASSLDKILDRTVEWVKFAEAKNGILLTLDAAAVAGAIGWLSGVTGPADWLKPAIYVGITLLILSVVVGIASFLPVLDFDFLRLKRKHGRVDSLLFFGSIAGCTGNSYLESLRNALNLSAASVGRLERDYADQIVVNAQIATAKYRMFRYAAWMSLAAIIIPATRVMLKFGF